MHQNSINLSDSTIHPYTRVTENSSAASSVHEADNTSSLFCVTSKENLRIMNINCRSLGSGKCAELETALHYIKPDIVCGTESWLRGVQPGRPATLDAIKSSEIFPAHYKAYRHDRDTRGGGVFVLVHDDLVAEERVDLVTECELEWVQVKLKDNKSLLISAFYLPHRKMDAVTELRRSLDKVMSEKERLTILAGDFNCPDIDWQKLYVRRNAQDRDVQQEVLNLSIDYNLTQVHDKPTREHSMLDLVFTSNPSLIKTTSNAPGISDHEIVIADCSTKPYYCKQRPRRCYIFSKANWDSLKRSLSETSNHIHDLYNEDVSVDELWGVFKKELLSSIQSCIPSKLKTKRS